MNEQIAYMAGFFDGEGCIYICRDSFKEKYNLQIHCTNINTKPLEIFRGIFGGGICTKDSYEDRRSCYIWSCGGNTAAHALEQLMPYLVIKKLQAEVALEFQTRRIEMPVSTLKRRTLDHEDYMVLRELKRVVV